MVSRKRVVAADKHLTAGTSAFNNVPVSGNSYSYDKESSHRGSSFAGGGENNMMSSSSKAVASAAQHQHHGLNHGEGSRGIQQNLNHIGVPNYTVHTGNRSNSNGNRSNLHVRQNFGKDHGYVPPVPTTQQNNNNATTNNDNTTSAMNHPQQQYLASEQRGVSNEMPFDVLNHMIIRDRSTLDGDDHQPQRRKSSTLVTQINSGPVVRDDYGIMGVEDEMDLDQGRFTIPPLRVSNPTPFQDDNEEEMTATMTTEEEQSPAVLNWKKTMTKTSSRREQRQQRSTSTYADGPGPGGRASDTSTNNAIRSPTPKTYGVEQPTTTSSSTRPVVTPILKNNVSNPRDGVVGDDSIFDFVEEDVSIQLPNQKTVKVTHKIRRRNKDNRTKSSSKQPQQQLQQQMHHHDDIVEDNTSIEDEVNGSTPSITKRPSPSTLQERAAEAWKVRRRAAAIRTSSLRTSKDRPPAPHKSSNVSFVGSDTVHQYEPAESLSENDTANYIEEESLSMDGRSLNSEYTKTLESEVEDMIKDILFIGNGKSSIPGRRKLKDKPEIKRRLRQQQKKQRHHCQPQQQREENSNDQNDDNHHDIIINNNDIVGGEDGGSKDATDESETDDGRYSGNAYQDEEQDSSKASTDIALRGSITSMNEGGYSSASVATTRRSRVAPSGLSSIRDDVVDDDDDDPFNAIWGLVEGGVAAVSYALGLDEEDSIDKNNGEKRKGSSPRPTNKNDPNRDDVLLLTRTTRDGDLAQQEQWMVGGSGDYTELLFGEGACAGAIAQGPYGQSKIMPSNCGKDDSVWYDGIAGGGSGSGSYENYSSNSKSQDDDNNNNGGVHGKGFPFDPDSMDQDPRLIHLALQAAKSLHQLKGMQYDESTSVDMISDVKMSIVELKLPLGLIFLENDGGCFVTKVAPDGSAARSGGVEVGDQLACINGVVSLSMKVGDICKLIPRTSNQNVVELGLLRYVGPLRPVNKQSTWDRYDILEAKESLKSNFEGQEVLARNPKKPEKGKGMKLRLNFFKRGKKRD